MNRYILSGLLITSIHVGCNDAKTPDDQPTQQVSESEALPSGEASSETVQGQQSAISADSLALFEDLAVDDPETRKRAIAQVNGILKKYRDGLPNQASYSSMKLYETYTNEFLKNYFSVDRETKAVWAYYISAELILRSPENEMKNATETLSRVEESCDCNAKEKQQIKEFNQSVLDQTQALLK